MQMQEFYNKVCDSLRETGNPYGSQYSRGWGWVNEQNPKERCAIARFIPGETDKQVVRNLRKVLGLSNTELEECGLVIDIITVFDSYSCVVNNKEALELTLKRLADTHKLQYSPHEEIIEQIQTEFA